MPKIHRRLLTFVLILSLISSLVVPASAAEQRTAPPNSPFWDVVGTQYQEPVSALYAIGVVGGTSPQTFSPSLNVTRAQMAAFLVRALGQGSALTMMGRQFNDVPESHWAFNAVGVAAQMHLINGVAPGQFSPEAEVTYEQAVAMLIRALGYENLISGGYPAGHVLKAQELGLLEGTRFAMGRPATRGDVALMLHTAVFKVSNATSGLTLSQSVFKRAVSLDILPAEEYLTAGSTKLSAVGRDWYGKEISYDVQWKVLSGDGVIDPDGTLTITGSRPVSVQAKAGDMTRTVSYQVINSFAINTPALTVKKGDVVNLSATGTLESGKTVVVRPSWRVVSGPATVDGEGKVTVTGSGLIRIIATIGRLSQEAVLASSAQIAVTPASQVVTLGGTTQFTAAVTDSTGSKINAPVTWSVISGDGRIDATGLFTASGSRTAVVQAASGDLKATARVQVISRLEVSPKNVTFGKAATQQFSVTAYTGDNQVVPVSASWRTEGGIGVIGSSGNFIATGPATGKVVAEYAGLRGDTAVTVAGAPVQIAVSLNKQNVVANGSTKVTVTATLVDLYGVKTNGDISTIYFALNNPLLGTLSASSASVVDGQATVTFTSSNQVGTAVITASTPGGIRAGSTTFTTNLPYLSSIRLEAYPNPLAADGASYTDIKAVLVDQDGQPYTNRSGSSYQVYLSQSDAAAGALQGGVISVPSGYSSGTVRFKASSTVGSTVISGSAMAVVSPITVQTTLVGPAAKLHINRDISSVKANGTDEMEINVEIQDANGNVRTGDNGTVVYITATNGDYNTTLASVPSVSGIAKIKFKTNKAGTFSLRAYTSNSNLAADEATAVFLAGPATKILLSADPTTEIAADNVSVVNLVAKVVDANNNLVEDATHQITFAKVQDREITRLPSVTAVSAVRGVATLQITATPWTGVESFKATATNLSDSNTITITSRIVGVSANVEIYNVTNAPVGGTATVKVRLTDVHGNVVTSANDVTIALSANSPTAVINSPQQSRAGVASFTVTDTQSGTVNLTATSGNLTADTTHAVTFTAGQPDHVVLQASPAGIAADGISRTTLTAKVVDAFRNALNNAIRVDLSLSNAGVVTMPASSIYTSGSSLTLTAGTTPGTVTITGVATNGYRVDPLTIQTYIAGAPVKAVVDAVTTVPAGTGMSSQAQIRVRIVDANGNTATSLNTGSTLTAMGLTVSGNAGDSTTLSVTNTSGLSAYGFVANGRNAGAAPINSGIATFVFTNTRAETVTLTPFVYYNGRRLEYQTGTVATTAGSGTQLRLVPAATTVSREYQDQTNLHITLADVYGNSVAGSNSTVTLRLSSSDYLTVDRTTVTLVNGAADVTVRSKTGSVSGSTIITATSSATGLTATTTIATDIPPSRPVSIWAADQGGDDTRITSTDLAVKVSFSVQPRTSTQQVFIYVNGMQVTVYTSTDFTTETNAVGAGGSGFVGYIRLSDLGGAGVKDIRAAVSNSLGMSPLSDAAYVTYAP